MAITTTMSKKASTLKLKLGKKAPAIMIFAGLAGMAGTVYLTYRASAKIEQAKSLREEKLKNVDTFEENGSFINEQGEVVAYSAEDAQNDRKIYNCKFWVTVAKHVAAPAGLFLLSAFLIYKGFKTEAQRLAVMGTALAGATAQLASVQQTLEEEYGKEKAQELMLGAKTHTETNISEEGEVTSEEVRTVERYVTGYTFEFSKASSPKLWSGVYKTDKDFIEGNLNHANYLLNEKHGYIFFNEILDDFDIKIVPYGNTNGIIAKNGEQRFVIFDVTEHYDSEGRTYFDITVNIDGYILDKI